MPVTELNFDYSLLIPELILAVAAGAIESSLDKITPSMDMAARSLGENTLQTLRRVHLPLIRPGLLTAALVVFVDAMKELPATLLLRTCNFDTLATNVYQYASDDLLAMATVAFNIQPMDPSWRFDNPVCDWAGVQCNGGRVTQFVFTAVGAIGTPQLTQLPSGLQRLSLNNNQISNLRPLA